MHGFAEGDANVFYGVVLVHVEIALRRYFEIEGSVAGYEIEHVIEETDAGVDAGFALAVEIEFEADIGLVGFAMNGGGARHERGPQR